MGSLGGFTREDVNLLKYTRYDPQKQRYLRYNKDGSVRELTSKEALALYKLIVKLTVALTFSIL